jgi:hypothetical protein
MIHSALYSKFHDTWRSHIWDMWFCGLMPE